MSDSGEDWSDSDTFHDPSFQLEFTEIEENGFEVEVESQIHAGRIVSLNLNKGALEATDMSEILVLMIA